MKIIDRYESEVRSYCRSFPTVFTTARGHHMWDEEGTRYLDFFAGAGVLNYGHNNPEIKQKVMDYLAEDGIVHSLDMATQAKEEFLQAFHDLILEPRGLDYKVQFPGPTGTNTVEAALKLARKVTGRDGIISFTNGFHGMTLGALAVTGNSFKRSGAGLPLGNTTAMPFDGFLGDDTDTIDYLEAFLADAGSGVDVPAAVIVETTQGEGGVNPARFEWLRSLEALCRRHDILMIIDDVQMGCGRTGPFFSFEPAGIKPDIVCMSKSIGGMGLPMAITLLRPDLDIWAPGEHNGTFRGHNLAFVAATEALRLYWSDDTLTREVEQKAEIVRRHLEGIVRRHPRLKGRAKGRGLIQGVECGIPGLAEEICAEAFKRKLIVETSGPDSEVVKVMPPLTIDEAALHAGLNTLAEAVKDALAKRPGDGSGVAGKDVA